VYVGFCSVLLLPFAIRGLTRGRFPLPIGLPSVEKQDSKIPNAWGFVHRKVWFRGFIAGCQKCNVSLLEPIWFTCKDERLPQLY